MIASPLRRRLALLTVIVGISMTVLDGTLANVALPTIAADLRVNPAASIWIVNAYQLTIVMSLLPFASLGEIVGYRRVYLCGMVLFTVAASGSGLAGSLVALAAARIVQGLGAAGIMCVNLALIRTIVPADRLGRTIGLNAMVIAAAATVGPTIAGGILSVLSWHWLFAASVPLGLTAFTLGIVSLPESPRAARPFDVASALLSALTFGLLISSINSLTFGFAPSAITAQFAVGLAVAAWFVRRQLSLTAPLLPLDLLRIPVFALSIGTSVCSFAAQMLAYVVLPFRFQHDLGFSAVETGLLITGWPIGVALTAPLAGRLADRFSAGILGSVGLAILCSGFLVLTGLHGHPTTADVLWRLTLCGMGFGLFQAPNNRQLMSSAPRERSGAASGMLATARLTGQNVGAAMVALLIAHLPASGTSAALFLGAAFSAVAAVVSALRLNYRTSTT
jgi:DHA2 family multidrug resistance protein-like MFS transporter